mmetsp:Transcript_2315/g.2631  ORF Transcript_2315/g.2631 Transcript_2315/m.2631 type:complete len:99 (+) Transcript_2315:115-411(+)
MCCVYSVHTNRACLHVRFSYNESLCKKGKKTELMNTHKVPEKFTTLSMQNGSTISLTSRDTSSIELEKGKSSGLCCASVFLLFTKQRRRQFKTNSYTS